TPSLVHVFAGANAPLGVADAGNSTSGGFAPFVKFSNVLVPAGGRAILMHFLSAERDSTSGLAAAQRLADLPPEALVGLQQDEIAAIRNFVVASDGSNIVGPFGTVSGHVLGADGVTPVPNASVLIGDAAPVFMPVVTVVADANGAYSATALDAGS